MTIEQTSLFADESDVEPPAVPTSVGWREVSQTRFLSWSERLQLAYCALRDRNSATLDPDRASFYLARAAVYEELSR